MAISAHHSKAGLRNYIGCPSSEKIRACSDILSDVLSGKSLQSLQPSFAALSSRAIFMFIVNQWQRTLYPNFIIINNIQAKNYSVFLSSDLYFVSLPTSSAACLCPSCYPSKWPSSSRIGFKILKSPSKIIIIILYSFSVRYQSTAVNNTRKLSRP